MTSDVLETPYRKLLAVAQLLLDIRNPRLPEIQENQADAIKSMVRSQGGRLLVLAQHMVEKGPNLSALVCVMPSEESEGEYVVLDGNRRITVLKLLENPLLAEGAIDNSTLDKIKRLSVRFDKKPITEFECVVYADREEADPWIELIHRGQAQGAGLVEWDGQVAARYDARKGSTPAALQVLDYVRDNGNISTKTKQLINNGRFPITNLERLINTPYVRKKLGIERENGDVVTVYPADEVLKGLSKMVEDLGSGDYTVTKLKTQDQRIEYINSYNKADLPDSAQSLTQSYKLGVTPPTNSGSRGGSGSSGSRGKGSGYKQRVTLVPSTCRLSISPPRIYKVFGELKKLNVDEYPNAAAVMLRVFIELSMDYFLEHTIVWTEQKIDNSYLRDKLQSVSNHMKNNGLMTEVELAPVSKAISGQTLLAASVKTMNGYVHSRYYSPQATELKTAWDDFQPFLEKVWA